MIPLISFLARQSRSRLAVATLASAIGGLSSTALVATLQRALAPDARGDATLLAIFVGLCVVLAAARVTAEVVLSQLTQQAMLDLRVQLGRQILRAPLDALERHGAGSLLALLTSDVAAIGNALGRLPTVLSDVVVLIGCLAYLAWLFWPAVVGALVVMMLGVIVFVGLGRRAQARFDDARRSEDRLFEHFGALTRGTKELKQHAPRRRAFLAAIFEPTLQALRRAKVAAHAHFAVAASAGQLMFFLLIGALVIALPRVAPNVSAGSLTGYALVLLYLVIPLEGLTTVGPILGTAATALTRITEMTRSLDHTPDVGPTDALAPSAWQRIELAGVTHRYHLEREDREFTLGPIDLALRPGELIFVVGGNGSGKTTLAKLLVGLYRPDAGELRVDGEAVVDAAAREAYRQLFTVVFADCFLFETMLGLDPARIDAQIDPYLRALQLDHKVRYVGGALSTLELSQGQRKRLALLTALLEDRPLYLFDEWAADQDPAYKHVFYTELLPELCARGKTIIVVSHDDRYFALADRLIKLTDGRIESDTPMRPQANATVGSCGT